MTATRKTENFPVASWLLPKAVRDRVLAFYDFARTADDIADDPDLRQDEKRARLDALDADADAFGDGARHARDLLSAFRQDIDKDRYADWDDLMAYCRLSAAPVGRHLIGLTGGGEEAWPVSDALCAALQVINHVQDCARDYRRLGRVYLPADWMAAEGVPLSDLGEGAASDRLRRVLDRTLDAVDGLLADAEPIGRVIADGRLAREAAGIHALARHLAARLRRHDPLAQTVRLSGPVAGAVFLAGALGGVGRRRRSSFYWGMRILPAPKRRAMFALYDFCRAVDDIADGDDAPDVKRDRLAAWRDDVRAVFDGGPVRFGTVRALAHPITRFNLVPGDFLDLISGMETDAADRVRMADDTALDTYCDRVASSVGRIACRIFGAPDALREPVAVHLGRALQLTNILRDVVEDAERGRIYLPALSGEEADGVLAHPALPGVMQRTADAAHARFADAETALAACGRCMRPARVMMEVYRRLLAGMREKGWGHVRAGRAGRPSLWWPEKIWIVLRYGVFG